ncbi:ASCH domain-containing protein [Boudabousia liubingyangii]|uniref:ASCH domain-containing protein n=1 Tax=Boudabousia liubingyangii TaxID=1921764 RepID=UPI0009F9EA22|nr:ASCH domain-containing protein [Boudabousia liubingyangii]
MFNNDSDPQAHGAKPASKATSEYRKPEDQELVPPNPEELEVFWETARRSAGFERLNVIIGQGELASVRPPAFQFANTRHVSDQLAQAVLDGVKTATASLVAEYEAEELPLPEVGELSILCDGGGQPVALLVNTGIEVCAFNDVNSEHAAAEGEGDRSLPHWRAVHRAFWATHSAPFWKGDGTDQVVCENFEVIYQVGQ